MNYTMTNDKRAAQALNALEPTDGWGSTNLGTRIVDMLTNLMHLVDQAYEHGCNGQFPEFCDDFESLVEAAKMHHTVERGDKRW